MRCTVEAVGLEEVGRGVGGLEGATVGDVGRGAVGQAFSQAGIQPRRAWGPGEEKDFIPSS